MAFSTQAQTTVKICDRTQQIQDEILRLTSTKNDTCDSVSISEMAAITEFSLGQKGVSRLDPGDFDGLTGVTILVLSDHALTELQTGTFRGLSSLTILPLNNGNLMTLAPDVFSDVPNLGQLFLSFNQLSTLPTGIFSGLSLGALGLTGNLVNFQGS